MTQSFFQTLILLLLVTDPFGNVPIFASTLSHVPPERRWRVIVRECLIAFVLLLLFMFFGRHFLAALQLSEIALQISGGAVLFVIAMRMIFPHPHGIMGDAGDPSHEPFIVPLAVPALAGPSALATVLLLSSGSTTETLWHIGALSAVAVIWLVVLLSAQYLQRVLGARVMMAFERLMGLILIAIAIEMLLDGIRSFAQSL